MSLTESNTYVEDCEEIQKSSKQKMNPEKEKLASVCQIPPLRADRTHLQHHNYYNRLTTIWQQQQQQKQKYEDAIVPQQLLYEFFIQSSSSSSSSSKISLKSIQSAFSRFVVDLKKVVVSALPYLAFLTCFTMNSRLRILPTADDARRVKLHNVSEWERYVLPCSVDRITASVHHPLLDLLAALLYLAHYLLPLGYPVYLYLSGRSELIQQFFKLLGWTMWVLYAIWFCLPTFPPWASLSLTGDRNTVNNSIPILNTSMKEGRAFSRVDRYIQLPLFHNLFSNNPVPFASFPSGHVAWPTCIFLTLPPGGSITFSFYIALMSWATMYSDHHYLLDAVVAILVVASTKKLISFVNRPPSTSSQLIA